jgi:L-tartrate/succinate antiporter
LKGFSNSTVWLVFGAFMFALGYEKTGLGSRIALLLVRAMGRRTLTLGYATTLADTVLAPFTPSNTARSGGIIFPVVFNLPRLYGSMPNDPSAKMIGSYLMWTTFAAGCLTSSLFMTACAPNFLAVQYIAQIAHVEITWRQWFMHSGVWVIPLLLLLPLLTYFLYAPQIKSGNHVVDWAEVELERYGALSWREKMLTFLVLLAITLWIFGGHFIDTATVTMVVIALMLLTGTVSWADVLGNKAAWATLILLASLVTLAGGLSQTGFVKWFADSLSGHLDGIPPMVAIMTLVTIYFLSHYMFASLTAHTTALMPVMLAMGMAIPDMPVEKLAMALAMTTGIMGVITPYATGAGIPYYESGYLPAKDFWRLGSVFGAIFLGFLLFIGIPILM